MQGSRNILCISVPRWKGDYASTIVELMKVLGQHNKVLYVQNPYTLKDLFSALVKRTAFPYKAVLGLGKPTTTYKTGGDGEVTVLIPPITLTINFLPQGKLYDSFLKFNGWLVRRSVKKHLRKLGMQDSLVNIVSFNPPYGVVNGRKFGESLLLYHCYDEIGEAAWMKNHGPVYERKFMKIADAVIVTSQGLLEKKSAMAKKIFLVKNAADISLFSTAFQATPPSTKTVGFIGSFDDRIDYDLLEYLADSMKDVRFLMIGRVIHKKGEARLKKYGNVEFTGSKKLEELPAFVKEFSVGIIPFVKNEFTKGIYPLKINEYLAAGIPVVSTDFGYLDDFKEVISIAENKEDFRNLLVKEINSDNLEKKLARQKLANNNSWEHRANELLSIVEKLENGSAARLSTQSTL